MSPDELDHTTKATLDYCAAMCLHPYQLAELFGLAVKAANDDVPAFRMISTIAELGAAARRAGGELDLVEMCINGGGCGNPNCEDCGRPVG